MEMFIDGLKTKGFHDKLKNNHFHIQQKKTVGVYNRLKAFSFKMFC